MSKSIASDVAVLVLQPPVLTGRTRSQAWNCDQAGAVWQVPVGARPDGRIVIQFANGFCLVLVAIEDISCERQATRKQTIVCVCHPLALSIQAALMLTGCNGLKKLSSTFQMMQLSQNADVLP